MSADPTSPSLEPAAAAAPARGRLGAKLFLAGGAILLALLAAEVGFRFRAHLTNQKSMDPQIARTREGERAGRVALIDIIRSSDDPKLIFELKPNMKAVPFRAAATSTNSLGFRYREVVPDEGDVITIVGLGDSIMFGWGVDDGKEYLAVLENMLRQKYPARTWRVINMAVPAYNTVMEVQTLSKKGLVFEPDLVIMHIVPNDLVLPQYVRKVENVYALDKSFLIRALQEGYDRLQGAQSFAQDGRDPSLVPSNTVDHSEGEFRDLVGWIPFTRAVDELKRLSAEHGFPVVTFSTVEDEDTNTMIRLATERGTSHVRLLPEIQKHMAEHYNAQFSMKEPKAYEHSDLVLSPGDGHPSVLQHWMAAEKLLKHLESQGLIARLMQ